jgi:hypothetical protein
MAETPLKKTVDMIILGSVARTERALDRDEVLYLGR